jgi:hypothetical protein
MQSGWMRKGCRGKKETWKAKEEVVTGLGGGPEGYAGWKVVEEGAE